jgi:hypothetical protein
MLLAQQRRRPRHTATHLQRLTTPVLTAAIRGPKTNPHARDALFTLFEPFTAALFPHTTTHEDSQDDRPLRTDFTDRVCTTFFYTLYFFTSFKILNKEKLTYLVYTTVN